LKNTQKITISIVSHGQACLVKNLLQDLEKLESKKFCVIITSNIQEDLTVYEGWSFPLEIISNLKPKGFGANHNSAFRRSKSDIFIILNPDIRLAYFKLNDFVDFFERSDYFVATPLIKSPAGLLEDSARFFPTVSRLIKRRLCKPTKLDYEFNEKPICVDWIGGMFMCFRAEYFELLNGFDEKNYFMYFEDVDICKRISLLKGKVGIFPIFNVVHHAQRKSRRNLTYFRWHAISAFRYLVKFRSPID
jgi:N-acetylglucosaminyl-diphospho-decaprenol L-rhamnosyltransferase